MFNKGIKVTIGLLAAVILFTSTPVDVFASKNTTSDKYMEGVTVNFAAGAHSTIAETVVLEDVSVEENDVPEVAQGITGEDVVDYALQFVGNKYVYGGTSLTNGTDCSGFVMRIYEAFGYDLPRTSYSQRSVGTKVEAEDIQPGDIVCYSGHVAIYMGDGKIVHASNRRDGIKITDNWQYKRVITIRRVL